MYYIGLDVHNKTISYCVKDVSGHVHGEGTVNATRTDLDCWMKTLPQPWTVAMEATIFTGRIYDHLLPHAAQVPLGLGLDENAVTAVNSWRFRPATRDGKPVPISATIEVSFRIL